MTIQPGDRFRSRDGIMTYTVMRVFGDLLLMDCYNCIKDKTFSTPIGRFATERNIENEDWKLLPKTQTISITIDEGLFDI